MPRARRQTQTQTETAAKNMPPAAMPELSTTSSSTSSPQSRLDRIAHRAYAIYERRGGQDGSSMEDWLQAEREIDSEA